MLIKNKRGDFLNNNLKDILKEYDQKRTNEINLAKLKKTEIYKEIPELEDIDKNIASLSISLIQTKLTTNSQENVDNINKKIKNLRLKKKKVLESNGFSEKSFLPKFECSKCNDTGYIETAQGNILCSCVKQKLYDIAFNNANIYNLENQNFDNFKLSVYSDESNPDKYNTTRSPRENIESIQKECINFINDFDNPSEPNLLFSGNTGLGKTFLSSCIANEMIKKGKNVLYQTAPIMFDKILDFKFGKTSDNLLDDIYSVDLLIIDDLGTETRSDYKITELFNIINSRLLNQNNRVTKTIISTNLTLQELYDTYEERIISRIVGNYTPCYFYGDDIRLKSLKVASNN